MNIPFDINHTFITSDHHFGSWKGLSFLSVFTKEQEDEAIRKWNSIIMPNDDVIYVGDLHDCGLTDLIKYKKRLNGNIHLIKGNHDFLPDNVYDALGIKTYDELFLEDLGLTFIHCPTKMPKSGKLIYGHYHRCDKLPFEKNAICVCASLNDGWPISLSTILS